MGGLGDWFKRAFTPSKSDNQSGAQYNQEYNENQRKMAGAGDDLGNLTDDEAAQAASKRAFRLGTYFTSPTGVLDTAPRRGTKLMGR